MSTLIGTLPAGAFHNIQAGPFVIPCLDDAPGDVRDTCMRPKGHEGRHAFIALSGRVWRVWGEDEHADARRRGHERLVESIREGIEAERQQLRDLAARPVRLGGAS